MTPEQIADAIRKEQTAAQDAAGVVRNAYRCGVDHILNAGALLIKAKEAVPHGEWGAYLKQFTFTQRTANHWMKLAGDPDEVARLRADGVETIKGLLEAMAKPKLETVSNLPRKSPQTPQKPPSAAEPEPDSRYYCPGCGGGLAYFSRDIPDQCPSCGCRVFEADIKIHLPENHAGPSGAKVRKGTASDDGAAHAPPGTYLGGHDDQANQTPHESPHSPPTPGVVSQGTQGQQGAGSAPVVGNREPVSDHEEQQQVSTGAGPTLNSLSCDDGDGGQPRPGATSTVGGKPAKKPLPSIDDARALGKRYKTDHMIIIYIRDNDFGYASYGRTRDLCQESARLGDVCFEAIEADAYARADFHENGVAS